MPLVQPLRDLLRTVGDVVPSPVTNLLDRSQAVSDNRERHRELTERSSAVIQVVSRANIAAHKDGPSPEVKESLATAESSLLAISGKLNSWNRWKTFSEELARTFENRQFFLNYQSKVEDVRSNLTLEAILGTWSRVIKLEETLNNLNILLPRSNDEASGRWPTNENTPCEVAGQAASSPVDDVSHQPQQNITPARLHRVELPLSFYTTCLAVMISVLPVYWLYVRLIPLKVYDRSLPHVTDDVASQIPGLTITHIRSKISPPMYHLPASPEPFFGRDDIMNAMVGNVTKAIDKGSSEHIALTGGLGMGKSAIAHMFLNRVEIDQAFGQSRHLISCQMAPNVEALLHTLADILPLKTRSSNPLIDIIHYLRFNPVWILIVFDNLQMPDDMKEKEKLEEALGKLRQFAHVHILVTTRDLPLPENVRWLHFLVRPLSLDAAMQTYKSISHYHDDSIKDLVQALDCVPLAIVITARQGQLGRYPAELLRRFKSSRKPDISPIDNVIRMALSGKRFVSNPEALALLAILARLPKGAHDDSLAEVAPMIEDHSTAVETILQSSLANREADGYIRVLAPTRSYLSRNHALGVSHEDALTAYYFRLCKDSNHELGTQEFERSSKVLAVEAVNARAILMDALDSRPTVDAIRAALGFSNFLYYDIPNVDVLEKVLEVIENKHSLDPDGSFLPHCLLHYGKQLIRLDRYHDAEKVLQKAGDLFNMTDDFISLGQVQFFHGYISRLLYRHDQASASYIQARESFQRAGDHILVAESLRAIATLSFQMGDIQRAVRLLDHARQHCGDHEPCAVGVSFSLAWALRRTNASYAAELLQGVRTAYAKYGARYRAALCLYQIGIVQYSLGQYRTAKESLLLSYQEFDALDSYGQMGYALVHLVELEIQRGNFEQALQYNGEARSIFEKIEVQREVANCYTDRARIHTKICQLHEARDAYHDARAIIIEHCHDPALLQMIDEEVKGLGRKCRPIWRMLLPW